LGEFFHGGKGSEERTLGGADASQVEFSPDDETFSKESYSGAEGFGAASTDENIAEGEGPRQVFSDPRLQGEIGERVEGDQIGFPMALI
jgi:hypothetical protein